MCIVYFILYDSIAIYSHGALVQQDYPNALVSCHHVVCQVSSCDGDSLCILLLLLRVCMLMHCAYMQLELAGDDAIIPLHITG